MSTSDELIRLSACAVVDRLRNRELRPLDLIDAALARIDAVNPAVNAIVTLCADRARDQARRLMDRPSPPREDFRWLGGLPLAVKDLSDVAGVRTTYGSPIFANNVPARIQANSMVHKKDKEPTLGSRAQFTSTPGEHLPDLALGMDVLRRLHLYVAFAQGKLYVTPAQ